MGVSKSGPLSNSSIMVNCPSGAAAQAAASESNRRIAFAPSLGMVRLVKKRLTRKTGASAGGFRGWVQGPSKSVRTLPRSTFTAGR